MSQRVRTAKTSAINSLSSLKSKKKSTSLRKTNHNVVQKKSSKNKASSTKRHPEATTASSSILTQPRQKRLSSLTATTLLQYCTSILSPSRKLNRTVKSTATLSNTAKTKQAPIEDKKMPRKRQISNVSSRSETKPAQNDVHMPTRTRREASSRASAMIMQQNEIERSRYNYSLTNNNTTSVVRRSRSKTTPANKDELPTEQQSVESFKFNIPAPPDTLPKQTESSPSTNILKNHSSPPPPSPLTTASVMSTYPLLTEASLAEHDRLYGPIPSCHTTKRNYLIKWTQDVDSYERLSPPPPLPFSEYDSSFDSTTNKSLGLIAHSNPKSISTSIIPDVKIFDSMTSNTSSRSFEHLSTRNNITTPTFLFPSSAYPLDLHSFYPILPCWQYSTWPFPSSNSLSSQTQSSSVHQKTSLIYPESKTKKSTIIHPKQKVITPIHKPKQTQSSLSSKNETLTFHLHTHHHHHIHNSNSAPLLKSLNSTTTKPFVEKKSSFPNDNKESLDKQANSKNLSPNIDDEVLNLSTNNKANVNQVNVVIKKSTRRKSSPVKRPIQSRTKSISSSASSISDKVPYPRKTINNNQPTTISSVSNNLKDKLSIDNRNLTNVIPKRRSISATTSNSITIISVDNNNKNLRDKRTNSASNIPLKTKTPINKKRSYSPNLVNLPLPSKTFHQRKKQKISNYWVLSGKSEQRLVSLVGDKPPVIRECYASIQHITEKDVINSDDCVILRPEADSRSTSTPYLAKVKWFWMEPTTNEIQMSLIWYYHPEHTELPTRAKERFLPNELLASKYFDCVNVACIEDKCYVLNLNEYNRYCLREKPINLFGHSESVGQLKLLLNKTISSAHHRPLPATTVGNQNIFFCRYVYDYRVKRILKNPTLNNTNTNSITTGTTTTSSRTTSSM